MHKRVLSVLLISALTAGLLAGCGSSSSGSSSDDSKAGSDVSIEAVSESDSSDTGKEPASEAASSEPSSEPGSDAFSGDAGASSYGIVPQLPADLDPDHLTADQLQILSINYNVWDQYDSSVILNGYGQVVNSTDLKYEVLSDILTGEPAYYTASYHTFEKSGDSYTVDQVSRLYALDGTILIDWKNTVYNSALGSYVTCCNYRTLDSWDTALNPRMVNTLTGEETDDIFYFEAIDAGHVAAYDGDSRMIGVLDADGNRIAGFPLKYDLPMTIQYTFVYKNYIFATNTDNYPTSVWIYDSDFNLLGSIEDVEDPYLYSSSILGSYVNCDNRIYDLSDLDGGSLEPIFTFDLIDYFDGELAVGYTESDENGWSLYRWSEDSLECISDSYSEFSWDNSVYDTDASPSDYFWAMSDGRIDKLDRDGNVIASSKLEEIGSYNVCTNGITVSNEDYDAECLLDLDLNPILSYGEYDYISSVSSSYGTDSALWTGQRYISDYNMRIDLLASDGSVLMNNLSSVGMMTNGLIPVMRGLSLGLIDTEGNWVLKITKSDLENSD